MVLLKHFLLFLNNEVNLVVKEHEFLEMNQETSLSQFSQ